MYRVGYEFKTVDHLNFDSFKPQHPHPIITDFFSLFAKFPIKIF